MRQVKVFALAKKDAVGTQDVRAGVQGEHYPCTPDIFHETYENVKTEEEAQC